jgi:hypothetical protein
MIRTHLRSHIVGYVALFVALSGTAVGLPDGDTVFSDDIVNGQVKTNDISNSNGVRSADVRDDTAAGGGLAASDLGPDSVGRSEIVSDAVGPFQIDADAVDSSEIATHAVGNSEIAANSVDTTKIGLEAVSKPDLASNAVGADAIVELHEHTGAIEFVHDGVAHDGAYAKETTTVSCPFTEKLVSVSIDWIDDNSHNETGLGNVPEIDRSGDDTATVSAIYDGGGGADDPAVFQAVATCFGP